MLLEIGLIAGGVPAGWLLRKNRRAQKAVGKILTWAVWALLFLLGLALGSDRVLLAQFDSLGLRAAVISLLSVAGSLLFARLLSGKLRLEPDSAPDSTKAAGQRSGEKNGEGA